MLPKLVRYMSLAGLAIALVAVVGGRVDASIAVPDLPEFTLEETGSATDHGMSANSGPQGSDRDDDSRDRDIETLLGTNSSTAPAPSSSGTSTSSGPSFSLAIVGIASPTNSDPDLAGWIRGQQCLILPLPVENELLRPPQLC